MIITNSALPGSMAFYAIPYPKLDFVADTLNHLHEMVCNAGLFDTLSWGNCY